MVQLNSKGDEDGFSLVEVLIAMGILTIGLLGLLAMFAQAVAVVGFGEDNLVAKQKAREALESIYTARNTSQISFSMIRNASNGGIFVEGFQPLYTPGPDGLLATDDDATPEVMVTAGDDGVLGTGDDETKTLEQYSRDVSIVDVTEDLRKVIITVRYKTDRGDEREYTIASLVSRFR